MALDVHHLHNQQKQKQKQNQSVLLEKHVEAATKDVRGALFC